MEYIYMCDIIFYDNDLDMFCFKDNYSNGFIFLIKHYNLYHKSSFVFYIEEDLEEVSHIYESHPEDEFDFFLIDTLNLKIFKVR